MFKYIDIKQNLDENKDITGYISTADSSFIRPIRPGRDLNSE